MAGLKSFVLGATALSSIFVSIASAKVAVRQDTGNIPVGTNLYNCHDNCGEATLEAAVPGFCNTTIFSTDYAACLQCSGTDNENVWQYYGPYLTSAAAECGSATTPLTGTQANVSTALVAQNVTSSTISTTATSLGGSTTTAAAGSTGTTKTSASSTGSASASSTAKSGSVQQVNGPQVFIVSGLSLVAILAAGMMI